MFYHLLPVLLLSVHTATEPGPVPPPPIFADGFEQVKSFWNLFPTDGSRWTNFHNTIEGNFVELSREQVHSGSQSLKCYATPFDGITASKAYIEYQLLQFVEGDRAWFEAWYFVASTTHTPNLFIWDIQSTDTCTTVETCPEAGDGSICSSPGRRLYLQNSPGTPIRSDLGKWCLGEDFTQPPGQEALFPPHQWVRIRVFITFSSTGNGVMQVWQDDRLILSNRGYTLPRADSIYDRLEIGITANGGTLNPATLFIDDITIWNSPPTWWLANFNEHADILVPLFLARRSLFGPEDMAWLKQLTTEKLSEEETRALLFIREFGVIDNAAYRSINRTEARDTTTHLRRLCKMGLLEKRILGSKTRYLPGSVFPVDEQATVNDREISPAK